MIRYFLLANLAILLHYLLYKLLLQNDTFFSLKRMYLLFAILFSLLFPIVWWSSLCIDAPETLNGFSVLFLNKSKVTSAVSEHSFGFSSNWFAAAYFFFTGILTVRFFLSLASIFKIKQQAIKTNLYGYTIYLVGKKRTPFTFLNMIFIDTSTAQDEKTASLILRHEYIHKIHFHSIDTLIAELASILLFCNPFMWLFKKELLLNLECIADDAVKKTTPDLSTYQYAIVNTSINKRLYITNQFNISQLKKRIIMLNKKQSKKSKLLKYTVILPITFILLMTSHLSIAGNTMKKDNFLNVLNEKTKRKATTSTTVVEWLNPDADLGEIAKGKPANVTYEFINHGKKPIIITNVKVSCGCTSKSYSKEPVQPGQKGSIKASYNAAKTGKFNKTITVTINDGSTPKVLKIRGVVIE